MCMIGCGFNFMLYFGQMLDFYQLEIMLFRGVFKKSVILMIPYSIVLLCFCFVLNSMLEMSPGYENAGYSFIIAMSMVLGEVDDKTVKLGHGLFNDYIITAVAAVFIISIVIVMMNLLMARAVNFSNDFMKDAALTITKTNLLRVYQIEESIDYIQHFSNAVHGWLKHLFKLYPEVQYLKIIDTEHILYKKGDVSEVEDNGLIDWITLVFGKFPTYQGYDESNSTLKIAALPFSSTIIERIQQVLDRRMNYRSDAAKGLKEKTTGGNPNECVVKQKKEYVWEKQPLDKSDKAEVITELADLKEEVHKMREDMDKILKYMTETIVNK